MNDREYVNNQIDRVDLKAKLLMDAIEALKSLITILKHRIDRHDTQIDDLYARVAKLEEWRQ